MRWQNTFKTLIVAILLVVAGVGLSSTIESHESVDVKSSGDNQVFLPVVSRNFNGTPLPTSTPAPTATPGVMLGGNSRFGVVTSADDLASAVPTVGAKWVRVYISWADIEPAHDGTYDFSAYDSWFQHIKDFDLTPIVEISGNPTWAATTGCGPIDKDGGLVAFRAFLQALVQRYGVSPYNVKNWEFYNEPDNTDPAVGIWNLGCWGNSPEQYVAMLRAANEAIKPVDPEAKVILGGLAHENPPSFFNLDFFDQVLAAGGGDYLDVVNVHYYSSQSPTWSSYGRDIAGKVGKIRETMASHGVTKPVAVTELGWTSSPGTDEDFPEKQARYVPKVLARSLAIDLYAVTWFVLADHEGAHFPYGLLDADLQPKLSGEAYKVAADEFGNANSVRPLPLENVGVVSESEIEGYIFDVGGQERWVLWAEGPPLWVSLPATATSAKNKFGDPIPLVGEGQRTPIRLLDDSPIYVRPQ